MRASGLYPAIATPVTSTGSVDLAAFDRLCAFALDRGADGLCIGGATSEYPRFEHAERLQLIERAARAAPRGAMLLAAIGGSTPQRTVDLGRAAFDAGCAAVLVPMPWFFRYQQCDLSAYCAAVAEALAGPCLLYDLPEFTNPLDPETAIALLGSIRNIVGLKDSSGRVENLLRFAEARGNRDWTLLIGDDRNGLAAIDAGWDGAVSGLACCCPELLVALHTSARGGDLERARRYQGLVDELITYLAPLPTPWGIRVALRARGIDTGPLPMPISPERTAQIARIEAWLPAWLAAAGIPNLSRVP
jgi:4-hydroxy-tetrahydrodipicolinate synthase